MIRTAALTVATIAICIGLSGALAMDGHVFLAFGGAVIIAGVLSRVEGR